MKVISAQVSVRVAESKSGELPLRFAIHVGEGKAGDNDEIKFNIAASGATVIITTDTHRAHIDISEAIRAALKEMTK